MLGGMVGVPYRLNLPTIDGDIDQNRRTGDVVVPDGVVHELKVPATLASFDVDSHQALTEQIIAGSMPPVVVASRDLDREVGQTEFGVHRHVGPDPGVAGVDS